MINIGILEAILRLRDELSPQLATVGRSLQSMGSRIREAGSALLPFSAAISGAIAFVVKFGKDFERTMVQVGNITDIGVENIGQISDAILEMSSRVAIGPEALARGLLVVASTGLQGAAALETLELASKASAVGLGETADIARAVTAALVAYGAENLSASEAANKLFVAVRAGGAEANEFAGSLGRVIGIASQVGISFDEILASVATFTRVGISADEAVTALRGTMNLILKPTNDSREALLDLGTSVEEVRARIQEDGLAAALIELVEAANGNEDALAAIIPNVRALAGVMATAGSQAESYRESLHAIQTETDTLEKAFQNVSDTVDFRWNQLLADAQVIAVGLFTIFRSEILNTIGPLDDLVEKTREWVGSMENASTSTVSTTANAAKFGAILAPLLIALGTFVRVVGFAASGLAVLFSPVILKGAAVIGALTLLAKGISIVRIEVTNLLRTVGLLSTSLPPVRNNIDDLTGAVLETTDAWEALAQFEQAEAERLLHDVAPAFQTLTDEVENLRDEISGTALRQDVFDLSTAWGVLTDAQRQQLPVILRTGELAKQLHEQYAELTPELRDVLMTYMMLTDAFAGAVSVNQRVINDTEAIGASFKIFRQELGATFQLFTLTANEIDQLDVLMMQYGGAVHDATNAIERHAAETKEATSSWHQLREAMSDTLDDVFRGLPNIIVGAFQGGGDVGKSIGSFIGGSLAQSLGETVSSALGGKLGNLLGGALGPLGAIGGGLLGDLIGGIFSIGGPSEAELAGRDLANSFRSSFVDNLNAEQLAEAALAGFENLEDAALVVGVRDLFVAAGLSAEAGVAAVQRLWDAIKEGPEATQAAIDAIQRVADGLAESEANAAALEQAISDLSDATSERAAVMQGALMDGVAAMKEFQDSGLAAGVAVPEAFRSMLEASRLLDDHVSGPLIEGSIAAGNALKSLDTIGEISQRNFRQFGGAIAEAFQKLLSGGASGQGAMEALRQPLAQLILLQENHGFTIDESTQALIDQARAHGITGREGKSAADLQLEALNKVVSALERLIDRLQGAASAAGGVASQVNKIPSNVTIGVGFNVDALRLPDLSRLGVPGFQGGTRGQFPNFGAGTLVTLHGRERVVTEGEARQETVELELLRGELAMLRSTVSDLPTAVRSGIREGVQFALGSR